jgi:ParB-like chromosome segregation protein Spo0J
MGTVKAQRYSIDKLLANGIQMFDDLDAEELAALGDAIGKKGPLLDPVSVTADGILIDGHQRLRAMRAQGRAMIDGADVRVADGITAANALEVSIQLNVKRRHLSVEQKAALARRLQHERGWSQGKIAGLFGVSRPAVNQWLAKTATDSPGDFGADVEPTQLELGALAAGKVRGTDGREYPAKIQQPERAPVSPWRPDGLAFRALHKARALLERERPVVGLSPMHAAKLAAELGDLVQAAEEVLNELAE